MHLLPLEIASGIAVGITSALVWARARRTPTPKTQTLSEPVGDPIPGVVAQQISRPWRRMGRTDLSR